MLNISEDVEYVMKKKMHIGDHILYILLMNAHHT